MNSKQHLIAQACSHSLPADYFNDPSACAAMEAALAGREAPYSSNPSNPPVWLDAADVYRHHLHVVTHRDVGGRRLRDGSPMVLLDHRMERASCAERAEAFGRTFRLWAA